MGTPHPQSSPAPGGEAFRVRTRNINIQGANRIHDNTTAKLYGFSGGLVAGSLVYAHMTRAIVGRLGASWLERGSGDLALFKPAYDGEWLTIGTEPLPGREGEPGVTVHANNEAGVELARSHCGVPARLPAPNPRAGKPGADPETPVTPIHWDAIHPGNPLRALHWQPSAEENRSWCEAAGDGLPIYQGSEALVQPGLVLQAANDVFSNHFKLDPWMHVSSRIQHRALVPVGRALEVRAVPMEKWEKKGHQFVRLYVAMLLEGQPAVEVEHTAIFRVRKVTE